MMSKFQRSLSEEESRDIIFQITELIGKLDAGGERDAQIFIAVRGIDGLRDDGKDDDIDVSEAIAGTPSTLGAVLLAAMQNNSEFAEIVMAAIGSHKKFRSELMAKIIASELGKAIRGGSTDSSKNQSSDFKSRIED